MWAIRIEEEIRHSARLHAGLHDQFIALTGVELAAAEDPFVRDSLQELLDSLENDRRAYADMQMGMPPSRSALINAA